MTQSILWTPSEQRQQHSHLAHFIQTLEHAGHAFDNYSALHQWSLQQPALFWQHVSDFCGIHYQQPAHTVYQPAANMIDSQWFCGATLNFAQHCLQRRDNGIALKYQHERGDNVQISYADLYQQVAAVSLYLRELGVQPGDVVAGILPDAPETIIAMLATTALGAIWSSCSPDFGYQGLYDRLHQISPKVLFTVTEHTYGGKNHNHQEKVQQLIKAIASIKHTIVVPYLGQYNPWHNEHPKTTLTEIIKHHSTTDELSFIPRPFNAPLYILFSSGTTGKPKCIVHSIGGTLIQHLKELMLHTDVHRDDTLFFYTTCSWMMWHWKVSSLAIGNTVVLYEGSPQYPQLDRLFNTVEQTNTSIMGVGAKLIESYQHGSLTPGDNHDLKQLKTLLTTGSPLLPSCFDYIYQNIKQDLCVSSISGGSDIISCFALGNPLLPVYRGELQCKGLGMAIASFDNTGQALIDQKGELVCTQAFPSMPVGFWNDIDKKRYHATYFDRYENVWAHGDYVTITAQGGVILYGRSDATLNPGGIRIGTAEIYQQIETFDAISDCLAVGITHAGDEQLCVFVQMQPNKTLTDNLILTIQTHIRQHLSPHHVPKHIIAAPDLPRTFNGKLCELAVKKILQQQAIDNTGAIANPECLTFFTALATQPPFCSMAS